MVLPKQLNNRRMKRLMAWLVWAAHCSSVQSFQAIRTGPRNGIPSLNPRSLPVMPTTQETTAPSGAGPRNAKSSLFQSTFGNDSFVLYDDGMKDDENIFDVEEFLSGDNEFRIVQGNQVVRFSFPTSVPAVQVLLKTDGLPLDAKIELLQGPNTIKYEFDVYCEDGLERKVYLVMATPGSGNVVRIINKATIEYPILAVVEPFGLDGNPKAADQSPEIS